MVAAFPLAKLGFLLVRQVSKPIATAISRRARESAFFRDWICVPAAQSFHWFDVRIRMRLLDLGRATEIPKMNEEKAIATGAQLLSELIILSTAAGILVYEYRRQAEKEEAKAEAIEAEKADLLRRIGDLEAKVEGQMSRMGRLTHTADHLSMRLEQHLKSAT